MSGERFEEFDKLLLQIRGGREPHSNLEAVLLKRIARLTWQSRRLNRIPDRLTIEEGSVIKGRTKLRYENSLGRQLREAIQQLAFLQMSQEGNEKW